MDKSDVATQTDCCVLHSILKDLECPICGDYMHPPIRQCIMGHSFCDHCFMRISVCGECRQEKSTGQSFSLESVHSKLRFPCRNRSQGCCYAGPGLKVKKHQEFCPFGYKRCPLQMIDNCQWIGPLSDTGKHCLEKHPFNVYNSGKEKLRFQDFTVHDTGVAACHTIFAVHNEYFRCSSEVNFSSRQMKWCVYHLGRRQPKYSKQYAYEIGFTKEGESKINKWLRGPCIPSKGNDGNIDEEDCVVMHTDELDGYCEGRDLTYVIKIINTDNDFY